MTERGLTICASGEVAPTQPSPAPSADGHRRFECDRNADRHAASRRPRRDPHAHRDPAAVAARRRRDPRPVRRRRLSRRGRHAGVHDRTWCSCRRRTGRRRLPAAVRQRQPDGPWQILPVTGNAVEIVTRPPSRSCRPPSCSTSENPVRCRPRSRCCPTRAPTSPSSPRRSSSAVGRSAVAAAPAVAVSARTEPRRDGDDGEARARRSSSTTGRASRDAASSCACCSRRRARATSTWRASRKDGLAAMMRLLDGERAGRAAVRAAVREGRRPRRVADRQRARLPGAAPAASCRRRRRCAREAQPDPAHARRLRRRDPRHPSPDRRQPLLRGPEGGGEAAGAGLRRRAPAEVPRLARAAAGAQPPQRRAAGSSAPTAPTSTSRCSRSSRACATPSRNAMARRRASAAALVALHDRVARGRASPPTCARSAASRSTRWASSGTTPSSTRHASGSRSPRPILAAIRVSTDQCQRVASAGQSAPVEWRSDRSPKEADELAASSPRRERGRVSGPTTESARGRDRNQQLPRQSRLAVDTDRHAPQATWRCGRTRPATGTRRSRRGPTAPPRRR